MHVLRAAALACFFVLLSEAAALAHVGHPHDPPALAWNWEPWIVASIALAAGWYGCGAARLWRRLDSARLIGPGEVTAYVGGLATLAVALLSPLDRIAEQLFWVHMVQHLLLLLVAAPLLLIGRPALAFLWAFGLRGRRVVGRAWTGMGLRRGVDGVMHPVFVWLLFCGAFAFWHFPGPYQWALRDETVHTAEHVSFLITALMFWSLVIEPSRRRRLDYGPTLVFVTTAAILSGLPGALITLAPRPLYPAHAEGVALWGLTLLQDQQLAGLVMWIPGGFIYVAAVGYAFVKWLEQADKPRHGPAGRAPAPLALLALCAIAPLLGGCDDSRAANPGANPGASTRQRAADLIHAYGCGSCHVVPGIDNADGTVGPPLTQIGRRVYIAGMLRNNADNMTAWLRNPQRVVPGNAMPDMGVTENDAQEIAAYLHTLR